MGKELSYHIAKNGMPAICRAKKVPCPLGAGILHYKTVEEAQMSADVLNQELERLTKIGVYGFAKKDGYVMATRQTERMITRLNNLRLQLSKLEAVQAKAREDLADNMRIQQVSRLDSRVGSMTYKAPSVRKGIDTEAFRNSEIFENYYLKEVPVSESVSIGILEDGLSKQREYLKNFENNYVHNAQELVTHFTIDVDENGTATPSEEMEVALKQLQVFKQSIDQAKALEKEIKSNIMYAMKETGIENFRVGHTTVKYTPQFNRLDIDRDKMRTSGIYDDFIKETPVKQSVTIRFNKHRSD